MTFARHALFAAISASAALLGAPAAHAHFKLLKPTSWLVEDEVGGPQKGSPCGPGNTRPLFGDDKQPIPASAAITTFRAGETITVAWEETVYHAGYFRIALAPTSAAAATAVHFPDPPLTDLQDCHYDRAAVQTVAHGNVLADGLFMATEQDGDNRKLQQQVTLPDTPCEHCTLQIVQVMEGHPGASCFYFHCAEIAIVAGNSPTAAAGVGGADSVVAAAPAAGGCHVTSPGASYDASGWGSVLLLALAARVRRRLLA